MLGKSKQSILRQPILHIGLVVSKRVLTRQRGLFASPVSWTSLALVLMCTCSSVATAQSNEDPFGEPVQPASPIERVAASVQSLPTKTNDLQTNDLQTNNLRTNDLRPNPAAGTAQNNAGPAQTHSILIPASPTEDSFTAPPLAPLRAKQTKGDQALGTFATSSTFPAQAPASNPAESSFGNPTAEQRRLNNQRPQPDDTPNSSPSMGFSFSNAPNRSASIPPITSSAQSNSIPPVSQTPPVSPSSSSRSTFGDSPSQPPINRLQENSGANFGDGFTPNPSPTTNSAAARSFAPPQSFAPPAQPAQPAQPAPAVSSSGFSNSAQLSPGPLQNSTPPNAAPNAARTAASQAPAFDGAPIRSSFSTHEPNRGIQPTGFTQPQELQSQPTLPNRNSSQPNFRSQSTIPTLRNQSVLNRNTRNSNQRTPNTRNVNSGNPIPQNNGLAPINRAQQQNLTGQFNRPNTRPTNNPSNAQSVRVANNPNTTTQPANKANTKLARTLLKRYELPSGTNIAGQPMTLLQMLQRTPFQNRRPMVIQYWETYFDWANLQSAKDFQKSLNTIKAQAVPAEQAMLAAARQTAQNDILAHEIQLGKSQSKLQELAGIGNQSPLPLPSQLPLIGYETYYQWYAQKNMLPARLIGVDEMLTKNLTLIDNRSTTVRTAQSALNQTNQAYKKRQTPLASVLESARMSRNAEKDLISSIVDRNKAIADYTLTLMALQGFQSPEKISTMLTPIVKSKTRTTISTIPTTAKQSSQRFGNRNGEAAGRNLRQTAGRSLQNQPANQPANQPSNQPANQSPSLNGPQGQQRGLDPFRERQTERSFDNFGARQNPNQTGTGQQDRLGRTPATGSQRGTNEKFTPARPFSSPTRAGQAGPNPAGPNTTRPNANGTNRNFRRPPQQRQQFERLLQDKTTATPPTGGAFKNSFSAPPATPARTANQSNDFGGFGN